MPENRTAVSQMSFSPDFSELLAQWNINYSPTSIITVILRGHIFICVPIYIVWNPKTWQCFERSLRKTLSSHNLKYQRQERQKLSVRRAETADDRRKGDCEVNPSLCETRTFTVAEVTEYFTDNPQFIHVINYCKAFAGHLENTKCWVLLSWITTVVWSSTRLEYCLMWVLKERAVSSTEKLKILDRV